MEEKSIEALEDIIPTKDFYMGLIMSTESAGLEIERVEKALHDWEMYYSQPDATNFSHFLCYLICKADKDNLFRLSKGFPEHIRIFAEKQILAEGE